MTRTFTIEVSDEMAGLLEAVALRSSAELGRALSLDKWLLYHVQMLAISNRLAHHVQPIQDEEQETATRRITERVNTLRDQLIAEANKPPPDHP